VDEGGQGIEKLDRKNSKINKKEKTKYMRIGCDIIKDFRKKSVEIINEVKNRIKSKRSSGEGGGRKE
jgi:hypothetical protein